MALQLPDLDDRTRQFMLDELEQDVAAGCLYLSPHLTEDGRAEYERVFRAAINAGTDDSLADELRVPGRMETSPRWKTARGGTLVAGLPTSAPDTLAEAEFHRYYVRGLCRRALADGVHALVICRAKPAMPPRVNSEAMIGVRIDALSLLEDLRSASGQVPPRVLPMSPGSGLTVRLR